MSLALPADCRRLVAEIRAAWDWLTEQAVPGPTDPPSERHTTAAQQHIEDREVRRDRAAQHLPAPAAGTPDVPSGAVRYLVRTPGTPVGPHPDAARVSPIHGRIVVAAQLRRAAEALHTAARGTRLHWRLHDPNLRPPGTRCHVCRTGGHCRCDTDDAQVSAALHVISTHLADPPAETHLLALHAALERANREARRAAGAADVHLVLKAACPACHARDLVADCTSPNRDEWSIRCRNRLCQCTGPACSCGTMTRYDGKAHVWPATHGQWHDLATRLGVTLTALIADAMRRPVATVGHTTAGKGGRG